MSEDPVRHLVVALTGASGSIYGLDLVKALLQGEQRVSLLVTEAGRQVLNHEIGLDWVADTGHRRRQVHEYFSSIAIDCLDIDDIGAAISSGSAAPDGMVVAPCSMGTAARIAAGLSSNLLERAADVMIKERRPLILVPRETPLSSIHLENLLRLAKAGATILPAMPAYYHRPQTIKNLSDFVVGKILDQLNVSHQLYKPWKQEES
jgi:4-hydroxy-3-polyprenylbenzoate decarboxylase